MGTPRHSLPSVSATGAPPRKGAHSLWQARLSARQQLAKVDPIFGAIEMRRRAGAKVEELKHLVELASDSDGSLWEKFSEALMPHNVLDIT